MQRLKLDFEKRSYNIVIDDSFAQFPRELASVCKGKFLIVTDTNVEPLYFNEVSRLIHCAGFKSHGSVAFEAGEKSKNTDTLEKIYNACIEGGLGRNDTIIALGGGVVGDIAGFVAATYMRGINFVQIPTTLLAQTDSSVGGKVGVDFAGIKNIVGAFKQPSLVYINTSTLKTLPRREFCAGMGEVIKYGIIKNIAFLKYLYENMTEINMLVPEMLEKIIYNCCAIKAGVVTRDETENGVRAILNFGHTIGHGIESAKGFELLHGECVALGMLGALDISLSRGYIDEYDVQMCRELILGYGLDTCVEGADVKTVLEYMKNDKKKVDGNLRFVLARTIGMADVYSDVTQGEIKHAIKSIMK